MTTPSTKDELERQIAELQADAAAHRANDRDEAADDLDAQVDLLQARLDGAPVVEAPEITTDELLELQDATAAVRAAGQAFLATVQVFGDVLTTIEAKVDTWAEERAAVVADAEAVQAEVDQATEVEEPVVEPEVIEVEAPDGTVEEEPAETVTPLPDLVDVGTAPGDPGLADDPTVDTTPLPEPTPGSVAEAEPPVVEDAPAETAPPEASGPQTDEPVGETGGDGSDLPSGASEPTAPVEDVPVVEAPVEVVVPEADVTQPEVEDAIVQDAPGAPSSEPAVGNTEATPSPEDLTASDGIV